MRALELLKKAGILTKDTKTMVTKFKKIENLTKAMTLLDKNNILTQENFRSLVKAPKNLERVANAFIRLNKSKILTAETRELVFAHGQPQGFAELLCRLKRAGLFTKKNYQKLHHKHVWSIKEGMKILQKNKIASQHHFNLMLAAEYPIDTAHALVLLNQDKLLSPKQVKKVLQSAYPFTLTSILQRFIRAKILTRKREEFLFSFKDVDYNEITTVNCISERLASEGILTAKNFDIVVKFQLIDAQFKLAKVLFHAKIFTEENIKTLSSKLNWALCASLSKIQWAVFNQEIFDLLVLHAQHHYFFGIITELNRFKMISPDDLKVIHAHPHQQVLHDLVLKLSSKNLLTQQILELFITNPHLFDLTSILAEASADDYLKNLVDGILRLQDSGLLTVENIKLWNISVKNITFRKIMSKLFVSPQLSQELLDDFNQCFVQHPTPLLLSEGIELLAENQLTTGEDLLSIAKHPRLQGLLTVLRMIAARGLLNAAHLLAFTATDKVFLVSEEAIEHIWNKIPPAYLTSANLHKLFVAAALPHPELSVRQSRDQILTGFNAVQNTHSSSIHRSVSASAKKLMRRYGTGINYNEVLADFKAALDALEPSSKHRAAQRGLENVIRSSRYFDPGSRVFLDQLLILAYQAIQDDSKLMGSVADAQALLVEGLYEMQRGGNIGDDGLDNGNPVDIPICQSGAFNKIIEKLNGIHADVEIYFITHASASAKLPIIAKQEAYAYLRTISTPLTLAEYQMAQDTLDKLQEDQTLERIWPIIQPQVQARIWEEFQDAYGGNMHAEKFIELMSYGRYVGLSEQINNIFIEMPEDVLVSSPRLSPLSFFLEGFDGAQLDGEGPEISDQSQSKRLRWF